MRIERGEIDEGFAIGFIENGVHLRLEPTSPKMNDLLAFFGSPEKIRTPRMLYRLVPHASDIAQIHLSFGLYQFMRVNPRVIKTTSF